MSPVYRDEELARWRRDALRAKWPVGAWWPRAVAYRRWSYDPRDPRAWQLAPWPLHWLVRLWYIRWHLLMATGVWDVREEADYISNGHFTRFSWRRMRFWSRELWRFWLHP